MCDANRTQMDCHERSATVKFLGKILIFITASVFIFVGLIINVLQLILLATISLSSNRRWRSTHKKLNGYLMRLLFVPPLFTIYYWSTVELNIYLDDVSLIEDANREILGVLVPNHSYELDYMVCFVLADQFGNMGAYKSFSKDELKYVPIAGWSLWMSDIIFVKRNWQKDKQNLGEKLNVLFEYDQILLSIFAEGTRWTREKHEASVEYAKSQNIKPFEHHLMPRSKGFNFTIRHYWRELILNRRMDEKLLRVANLEIMFPGEVPSFSDYIKGKHLRADVYCEEVQLTEELREEVLNSKDEDDCPKLTQFLMDIYRRKDEIVSEYRKNGGKMVVKPKEKSGFFPYKKNRIILIIWFLETCFTYLILIYLATSTSLGSSGIFWVMMVAFFSGTLLFLSRVEQESQSANSKLSVKWTQNGERQKVSAY